MDVAVVRVAVAGTINRNPRPMPMARVQTSSDAIEFVGGQLEALWVSQGDSRINSASAFLCENTTYMVEIVSRDWYFSVFASRVCFIVFCFTLMVFLPFVSQRCSS